MRVYLAYSKQKDLIGDSYHLKFYFYCSHIERISETKSQQSWYTSHFRRGAYLRTRPVFRTAQGFRGYRFVLIIYKKCNRKCMACRKTLILASNGMRKGSTEFNSNFVIII